MMQIIHSAHDRKLISECVALAMIRPRVGALRYLLSLRYENVTTSGQGKGSTEWASHSHTPLTVVEWTDFDELVAAEGEQPRNTAMIDVMNLRSRGNAQKSG